MHETGTEKDGLSPEADSMVAAVDQVLETVLSKERLAGDLGGIA